MNLMRIIGEATHTVTSWLTQALYKIDKADGTVITLPDATGTGFAFKFIVGVDMTADAVIQVASSSDIMAGMALAAADTDSTVNGWETAADTDTITLDGSTTGGLVGDVIMLTDIGEGLWHVDARLRQTGTEATPFSAAV